MSKVERNPEGRLSVPTGAAMPDEVRRGLLASVRERLLSGELDSDQALVETALALLDGDLQKQA
jgi:hypothetical protein